MGKRPDAVSVIFEDDELLVLEKPSGWVVNDASTVGDTPVVQRWLSDNYSHETIGEKVFRCGIVHRLDKDTSGVLITAKKKAAFRALQNQFKQRSVSKTYKALVHGKVEPLTGSVKAPVGRLPWNRERFGVLPGGRAAETKYSVVAHYGKSDEKSYYSLLDVFPITGRTHQIRIHMKYLKHPVVSDVFYAGRKRSRSDLKWCPRLFLHAAKIEFLHPKTKRKVEFVSPLPQELEDVIDGLESLDS
ncbi:MAG: RluA family pseudouridine synthase [Candidatus Woesebacteria bacterium]|jgi:23S rRNA pseudouridine1911/1915/1917 synthase